MCQVLFSYIIRFIACTIGINNDKVEGMVTIEIGNSYSRITGLSAQQEKELRQVLSYVVGGSSAHFSGYGAKRRSLLDKKGNFPTGLYSRVHSACIKHATCPKIVDTRAYPGRAFMTTVTGYKWQLEALNAASKYGRGILSAPTGTGKSRVIHMICQQFGLKTLIVVPSLEIRRQLAANLKGLRNVTVENIDSKSLQTPMNYDCLIIDEGHHVAAKTYHKLNKTAWGGIYHRFFLTATPFRNDTEETLLFEAIAGQVIYKLDYLEAIKENYIVPVEAFYVPVPKQPTDACTWAEVYRELIVNNEPRNIIIGALLARLHAAGQSTLCLVKEIAHGKILSEMTGLPFISGVDEESRSYITPFSNGEIPVVIATTGVMGEGIDTRACEYVVIAGLGKAKSQFQQQVGRAVRTFPGKETAKIVLFRDESHKYCLKHYRAQAKILKEEYGVKPERLDI